MDFATNPDGPRRIALVLSPVNQRRLTTGLQRMVGPQLDFGAVDSGQPTAKVIEQVASMNPKGLIVEFHEELTEAMANLGMPTVTVLADMLIEGVGCVNVDDWAVGQLAADYLWEKDLRHFAFYGFTSAHAPGRLMGFRERLRELGAVPEVIEIEAGASASRRIDHMEAWLLNLPRPVAIFAAHDPLAREVAEGCRRLGLEIPSEVAVLSASNDQFTCELVHPGISSVEIPWAAVGLTAVHTLVGMMNGQPPGEPALVAPTGIRTRGSTGFFRVADPSVQAAISYMRERLADDFGIDSVARHAGIDRRALERRFRALLNRSPKQVLTHMRTGRARELLEQTSLRIGEIATACGFGNSERLAAAFRKRYGCTPREWTRPVKNLSGQERRE